MLTLLLLPLTSLPVRAQEAPDARLEKAVAALRHVVPDRLNEEQQKAKTKDIEEAWATIEGAGQKGLARLRQELQEIDKAKGRDDFFKLNASALLWKIGKLGEAESIAEIWRTTPLSVSYNYPFYTAIEAAATQDERALPMLRALLADREGRTFFSRHAMEVRWPLTHEFVWGAFGPKGLRALMAVLETSQNPTELFSALSLLAHAQHLPALPRARELATKGTGEVRQNAIFALGIFGHPQDYELLLSGLPSSDPVEHLVHALALYEFGDLRAVPHLIPLLQSTEPAVRSEALSGLRHLLTPMSLEALQRHSEATKDERERDRVKRMIERVFEETGKAWPDYLRMSASEKETFVAARRRELEDVHILEKGERPMSRAEFLAAAAEWKKKGRLEDAGGDPVEVSHILSAATVDDINLLLDVKARFYLRLSDEALYETRRIDGAVQHLGRGRYRKVPGITEKAEAK